MQINAINAALGRKVAEFRKAHGWSQAQLAEMFGTEIGHSVDPTAITRMEQGKRPVPVHELIALSHVLAVEPTVFFKFMSPLDDAIAALQLRGRSLEIQVHLARDDADFAREVMDALKALRRYRDTRSVEDLGAGLTFLITSPKEDRPDWRELLLDAGVPNVAIDAALKAAPGFPGDDPVGEVRTRFINALLSDVASPPRRRRKTGKVVK